MARDITRAYTLPDSVLGLGLDENVYIIEDSFDPTSGAGQSAPLGSLFLRTDVPGIYLKDGAPDTGWTLQGTGSASFTNRIQAVYVGKHGSAAPTSNGRVPDDPFDTFAGAITYVNTQTPSTSNRWSIICEDGGTYTESFTIPSWVMVKAPNATFAGNIVISDDSEFYFQEVTTSSGAAISKPGGTSTGWATGEIVRVTGAANGITNAAATSVLIVRVRQVYTENGTAILDLSTGTGHIHMDVEDVYITGTGTGIDRQSNTGIIVGRVSHILEQGGGIGNGTALDITDGRMTVNVGTIDCATAYTVAGTGTLNLFVNDIVDTAARVQASGLAEVNVIEADSLRWINQNSTFTARRVEFVSIDTTPGALTMNLPNPASNGDSVSFQDALNTFGTNNLTIDAGTGGLIDDGGAGSQTVVLDISGTAGILIYNETLGLWTFSRIQEEVAFSPDNVIYVTKNGSDTIGDGSFSNPFLTIKRGVQEALTDATPTNPTTVKVLDGIYDEVNPINVTGTNSEYVQVQGSETSSTIARPTVNGQPLFTLTSNQQFDGPTLSRMTLSGRNNGGTDYRTVAGGSLVQVSGNGTFDLVQMEMTLGYVGLDTGNGTITTSQTTNWDVGSANNSRTNIEAKSSARVTGQVIVVGDPVLTSITASNTSSVELSNYDLCGDVTQTTQNGTGLIANDTANIFLNGGLIHSHVLGVQANDSSNVRIVATEFTLNTTEFDQVDATATVQIQGTLSKTNQAIADGALVSLNYIDSDTGDYIVGNADATGTPGKEFRVRDADGRIAIGDNATDTNIADGGVGGSRTINLIDTNGNMRIWRYVTVDGQDPALEWIKGTATTADGAGDPAGANPGDPAADVQAGLGTVWWDMFLQETDSFVIRRRTGGGGSLPDEKVRVFSDHSEWLGATLFDNSDVATILYLQTQASAVNYLQIDNAATGNGPELTTIGTDTNIDIEMIPKGTGTVVVPAGYDANITAQSLITQSYFAANAGTSQTHLSRHNGGIVQTFTTTPTTINFGTNIRNDADYTHAIVVGGSEITINTSGWYEITYDVGLDSPIGNSRTSSQTELQLNGTLVAGTRSWGYHRNAASAEDTSSATIKLNLSATDVVRVQSVRLTGTNALVTLANGCRLNIQSIDGV